MWKTRPVWPTCSQNTSAEAKGRPGRAGGRLGRSLWAASFHMQPGHVVEQKVAEQRQLRGDRGSGSEAGGACAGGQLAAQREQRRHALEPAASLPRIGEGPHHGPQPCGSGGRAAERDDQAVDHEERVLGEARQLVSRLGLRQETLQGEQQPARDHVEELEQVLQLPGEERLELEARVALLQADVRRAVKVHRREPVEEEARAEPRGHGEGEPRCTALHKLGWRRPPTFGQHFPEIRWDSARSQSTVLLSVVWWSYLTWWL